MMEDNNQPQEHRCQLHGLSATTTEAEHHQHCYQPLTNTSTSSNHHWTSLVTTEHLMNSSADQLQSS